MFIVEISHLEDVYSGNLPYSGGTPTGFSPLFIDVYSGKSHLEVLWGTVPVFQETSMKKKWTGVRQRPNETSPNYWGNHLQHILEGDDRNPQKGTFTIYQPLVNFGNLLHKYGKWP